MDEVQLLNYKIFILQINKLSLLICQPKTDVQSLLRVNVREPVLIRAITYSLIIRRKYRIVLL